MGNSLLSGLPNPAEARHTVFDRKVLVAYGAIKHFNRVVEGRHLVLCPNHKTLMYILRTRSGFCSSRVSRHLEFIFQPTTDYRPIKLGWKVVADASSRQKLNAVACSILGLPPWQRPWQQISLVQKQLTLHHSHGSRYHWARILVRHFATQSLAYPKTHHHSLFYTFMGFPCRYFGKSAISCCAIRLAVHEQRCSYAS